MKNCIKILTFALFSALFGISSFMQQSIGAPAVSTVKPAVKTVSSPAIKYITVNPLDVVNTPGTFLNKNITFDAEFIAFSSLGLDYKPALREASKYIAILIKRSDAKNHVIPLSEMKIFITREEAEKNIDLEQGDKIKIEGKVFSTALGDPWVDVKKLTVLSQKNKNSETAK